MVRNLATRFSIVAKTELERLVEEFQDYQWSPDDDLPAVMCDSRVDTFWAEMGSKKTFVGAVRFPLLTRVITTLSVIAHSNAVNVCFKWFERLTRTRIHSSSTTPSVHCCLARSTQMILAMRLSHTRIFARQPT